MQSITHSTIQSITHLIIHSTIYSIIHSIIHSMIHSMGHRRNTERTPTGHQRDTVAEGLGDARSGARVHTMTEHRKDTDGTLKPQQKQSQRTTAHQGICNASPALQQKNVHAMTPCMLAFPCMEMQACKATECWQHGRKSCFVTFLVPIPKLAIRVRRDEANGHNDSSRSSMPRHASESKWTWMHAWRRAARAVIVTAGFVSSHSYG